MKQVIAIVALFPVLLSGELNETPDRYFDVIHSKIDIRVDINRGMVAGEVTHRVTPLRTGLNELFFHASDMNITEVLLEKDESLAFTVDEDGVLISLKTIPSTSDTFEVSLSYEAYPTRGVYFIRPDSLYPEKHTQAWTQGEDTDNHYWVPLYDYPNERATFEVMLTVDKPFTGLSNGALINVSENDDTRTFHWHESYPMVPYLISFVVGEYQEFEQNTDQVPIGYWVYPEHTREDALRSFGKTPDMMKFFNNLTGIDYPYEKYDQVIIEDFMWGGMENITLTHQTDRTMHPETARPDHTSDGLVAHELAHQWYGDMITTRNWANIWLNEGFATFLTYVWLEEDRGNDEAEYDRMDMIRNIRRLDSYRRRPTVEYNYTYSMDLFNGNVYDKGAVILNMLRTYLGETDFWRAIQVYTKDNMFKNVETADLKKTFEEVTGQNLYWFFDQWLYKGGMPEYSVSYKYNRWSKELVLNVSQTQDIQTSSLFRMPVNLLIDNGEMIRKQVWIETKDTSFVFPLGSRPEMVLFDEGFKILKRLDFQKNAKELTYQGLNAPSMLDRLWAIEELGKLEKKKKVRETLTDILDGNDFWGLKVEAARSLGNLGLEGTDALLRESYRKQDDSRVKKAIVKNLKDAESSEFLRKVVFSEKADYLLAEAVNSLINVDQSAAYDLIDTLMTFQSHNDIIRNVALKVYNKEKSENSFRTLQELTVYGKAPYDVRAGIFGGIAQYWDEYPEVREIILSHLSDPSRSVRKQCVSILGRKGDASVIPHLENLMETEKFFIEDCTKAIKRIQNRSDNGDEKEADPETQDLKDKIFRIRKILDN